jgi:hypothetical protein
LYNKYHTGLKGFREAAIEFFINLKDQKKGLESLLAGGFEGFN